MALQHITAQPKADLFTPLAEHQGQTPATFFGGKPVLYHHSQGAELLVSHEELQLDTSIAGLAEASPNGGAPNGAGGSAKVTISGIEVWVNSETVTLWSTASNKGVRIPYPSIALHALQPLSSSTNATPREALLMHITTNDTSLANADEDYIMVELSIIPSSEIPPQQDSSAEAPSTSARGGSNSRTPARLMYNAVSQCADLHPDPQEEDDDEEGEGEDMAPGAGGWITAENADQYFDEDGNFVGQQILGPGAGSVRGRDDDAETQDEVAEEGDDTKWRKTG